MASLASRIISRRTLLYFAGGTTALTAGGLYYLDSGPAFPDTTSESHRPPPWTPPSRAEMLSRLRASSSNDKALSSRTGYVKEIGGGGVPTEGEEFDLLVIGGGATGAGVALDAATRGLKVALVERDDFSSGTSSKSTKLVHGGVRYLQKAVFELDYNQYKLVKEALSERRIFLSTAPYLSAMLPIMLPIYKLWQVPYYYAGCKMYDILAGKENMESSYYLSKGKALEIFPMLKSDGLVGAVVYYDGQHNDSRMNIALIMTAVKHGATVANYCEVTSLTKDAQGKLTGAVVRDTLQTDSSSSEFTIRAKGIINATGPYTDALLTLDNPAHAPIVRASSGVHITLPGYYSPRTMGLLDPSTSDGRVIFFLPWQGNTIAGTTERAVDMRPASADGEEPGGRDKGVTASEDDIRWVLDEIRSYLSPDIKVRRGDVLSAWSGLRPLIRDPSAPPTGTQGLVRSHVTHLSPSGLLTIAGGKWTTYRKMAEETVDEAVTAFGLQDRLDKDNGNGGGCITDRVRLVGSDGWSRNMFIGLIQTYGLETEVARHLSDNYGDRAWTVCALAEPTGAAWPLYGKRLSPMYPFIEAEVRYAIHHEYAQTPTDVLARRTRLSFLNARAALDALPLTVQIMSGELGWGPREEEREVREAVKFLRGSMGLVFGAGESEEEAVKDVMRGLKEQRRSIPPQPGSGWMARAMGAVGLGSWAGRPASSGTNGPRTAYGRARFGPGELAQLRTIFVDSVAVASGGASDEEAVRTADVLGLLRRAEEGDASPSSSSGVYASATPSDLTHALSEAGLRDRTWLRFEEFVEVVGRLKEVAGAGSPSTPVGSGQGEKRRRIPVEKSGGGV